MSVTLLLFLWIGLISLDPQFSSTLGGTPIVVSGPRFRIEEDDQIVCSFNRETVTGIFVAPERALCVSPPLTQAGRMPFEIEVTGSTEFFGRTTFVNCKYIHLL